MSGVFSSPKMPEAPTPVEAPAPTVDEGRIKADEEARAASKRGKRMNILAGWQRNSLGSSSKLGD